MSMLTQLFPVKLKVDGVECPIHSDFRTVLRCYEIQGDRETLSDEELLRILRIFYKKQKVFSEGHVNGMFWFFACGRKKKKRAFPRRIAGINDKQPFDFKKDADLIYAGFMQQYGIDLQKENMHWWRFMILLENLGTATRLSRIMEYRTIDTGNKNLSKREREFYRAMQRYYGLDMGPRECSERVKQIEEALLNGGDVSQLLR